MCSLLFPKVGSNVLPFLVYKTLYVSVLVISYAGCILIINFLYTTILIETRCKLLGLLIYGLIICAA
jgi:hypothetical protein